MFVRRDYCRYCDSKCIHLKKDKNKATVSLCKKTGRIISYMTPKGGNIKAPDWCPKRH